LANNDNNLDWDEISKAKKGVRASDKKLCGNVIAEYHDSIIVIEYGASIFYEYMIPKSRVDHYDGKEVYLNIPYIKMLNFDF
jgi:hypothetical protein